MFEQIIHNDKILAIIVRNDYTNKGVTFFTANDLSQQVAYMNHPKGRLLQPHIHNPVKRDILDTKEVLLIKKGKIKCDFYTDNKEYLLSRTLESGDLILLSSGGHGFEMLEDTEMFEIKQGPYAGENDKTRFKGVNNAG